MYSSARRSVVPDCARIQVINLASTSEVTNWRSSSERWAVVTMAQRGRPSGRYSSDAMSSGTPAPQAANDGDASRPLRRTAKVWRSFAGKNWSSSSTPRRSIGGRCTWPISVGRSSDRLASHAWRMRFDSRMCSRPASGSASTSTSPSRPVTKPSISSAIASPSSVVGASSDPTRLIAVPACEPGV